MTLKRQLLLVSLLTLMLPWAGCQFIRETESALREGQQQMLAGTAKAIAESMAQYSYEFPPAAGNDYLTGDQLYGHRLDSAPEIDGYFDDWSIGESSLRDLRGTDGPVRFAFGLAGQFAFLYVAVSDHSPVFADSRSLAPTDGASAADRIRLISSNPPYLERSFTFTAEAPGAIVPYLQNNYGFAPERTIRAYWQDVPGGYQLEARLPISLLGTHLGLEILNATDPSFQPIRSRSFSSRAPGAFVTTSDALTDIANGLVQPGMRLILTDAAGWRIAAVGEVGSSGSQRPTAVSTWLRLAYNALVEPGREPPFAEPDPRGREQQPYIVTALGGRSSEEWFRSSDTGSAIVAAATPISDRNGVTIGAAVLQLGTDSILSLRNRTLARLMNVTLIAMLVVGAVLLGYATILSRRIRHLSIAAEGALENDDLHAALPSALASDEIGDLSRSFSYVLDQLGDYNDYLRTLASKLSHELRTPLTIVTSSLENLEHEPLSAAAAGYTVRAKDGAERLRRILGAMSEASRVEEIMKNADPEDFDLRTVIESTVDAYSDAYPDRRFELQIDAGDYRTTGSPELIIQMLDKLVDNAVGFSKEGDNIALRLGVDRESRVLPQLRLDVINPGPPLPDRMRGKMFESMVSVRPDADNKHLGLGLYVAKLIADGHSGRIGAENIDGGVQFSVWLPMN